MSIKISYKKVIAEKNIKNYVLFSNEDFAVYGLKKLSLRSSLNQINKTINNYKSKKKDFLNFNISPNQKIILIKVKKNNRQLILKN